MLTAECFTCTNNHDAAAPRREQILRTDAWRVAHALDAAVPGWLVVASLDHVLSLDELSDPATLELGPLLRDVTAALRSETGCAKTYVALFAEKPGSSGHLHVHVVPRAADLVDRYRGPGIFELLGVAEDRRVTVAVQDALAARLAADLATRRVGNARPGSASHH